MTDIIEKGNDILDGLVFIDIPTFNFVGEVALDQKEKVSISVSKLAKIFHHHIEKIFSNQVCDERGDRENMIGILELNLKTTTISYEGKSSKDEFISIGTVLVKETKIKGEKGFIFKRNPLRKKLYQI